jgi:N-acetylglucosaminyldiphosphoundecaprenol N-acetyl-beta-D-mannosaminyltransferase
LLNTAPPPTARILGLPLHCLGMDEAVERVAQFIGSRRPHLVVTLGTEMVMQARHDERFRQVAQGADLLVPDSIGVVWAARRQGFKVGRVAGIDLLGRLAERGAREGWRFYFLGARPGVAEEAAARLVERHPGLVVAGCQDGFFKDDRAAVDAIAAARADILLVALGSPRQELWCREHGEALGVPVAMGVGGSFDVLAGRVQRAPAWMRRFGLEWLYRLWLQPSRFIRMLALPRFALTVLLSGERS